jgi:hypothetical protein
MMKIPKYKRLIKDPMTLPVDRSQLSPASLRSYDVPLVYNDRTITCRACKKEFVFTAVQQKKLYEEHKRHITTTRVLCTDCKIILTDKKKRLIELEGLIPKKGFAGKVDKDLVLEVLHVMKMIRHYSHSCNGSKYARYKKMYENLTNR